MFVFNMNFEDDQKQKKIEEIYILYRKLMYYTAYNVLNDHQETEDAVHTAIINVYNHLEKINDVRCNKTKAFIVIIIRNIAINNYNRRKTRPDIAVEIPENIMSDDDLADPEQCILKIDNAEWVARKLADINPDYADVLVMKYTYQFTNSEIACLMSTSEVNIRVKLYRARKALKEIIKDEYQANR